MRKKDLATTLSRLKTFSQPREDLEQYPTDSEIAADVLHNARMLGDLEEAEVLDLGGGTGILSIGAILSGAKRAHMIEIDNQAIADAKDNIASEELEEQITINRGGIAPKKADIVIMNPPFGSKNQHADRAFLQAAMNSAPIIYSFHNQETLEFLKLFTEQHGYTITHVWNYQFPIKQTYGHHKQKIKRIPVVAIRCQKDQ